MSGFGILTHSAHRESQWQGSADMMPRAAFAMVLVALGGCTPFDRPYEIKYPSSESDSRYAPVQQYGPYVTPRPFGARPPAAAADASNGQTPYPVVARISAPATLAA